MKYITVPISFAIYKVHDQAFEILSNGMMVQPPAVVLEVMALNGQAEQVGIVGWDSEVNLNSGDEEEGGATPWVDNDD